MNNNVMYELSYGLYILTAKEAEKDNGCVINTAVQVTSSPNRISIAVNKQNYTHDMINRTGRFNISVIDESAPFALFQRFGFQSGREIDKLEGFPCPRGENGIVYIDGFSYISASVYSTVDLGTHTLFLADVKDGEKLSGKPPMTYAFYHANVKPKPGAGKVKGFRCKICGYVYEGETLPPDFICPICKHGAEDFEVI